MSLIEYLEHGDWRGALRRSFEGALHLLQTDRFGRCSSAVDDVKSWLAIGGVSRVKLQLDRQMEYRDLEESHQEEIRDFLGQLVQGNQRPLLQLMANGIIPWNQADFLATCSISESEFDAMLEQIASGANPFETWMLENGYSQEVIDKIYEIIDSWLVKNGLSRTVRSTDPNLN
ncbi:hypothetical protein CAL7716_101480 (plasmid) [Calothrix sp. PCC 7716]|nr:hypothetical protein CAL7716_101480 [Calothrix sp. PCC 7716]